MADPGQSTNAAGFFFRTIHDGQPAKLYFRVYPVPVLYVSVRMNIDKTHQKEDKRNKNSGKPGLTVPDGFKGNQDEQQHKQGDTGPRKDPYGSDG